MVWRKRTCSQASYSGMTFFSVTLRKKRAMWTSKWGLKSGPRFGGRERKKQFGGPQNGVQILHPILGSTLHIFFVAWRRKKSHMLCRMFVSRFLVLTTTCPGTGEDRAEGASFWYAFLTPVWGPKNSFFSKETMLKPMSGLSQIQDKPSKSLD